MSLGNIVAVKKVDGKKVEKNLTMRWLEDKDLDQVYELMEKIYSNLENKELFMLEPKKETFQPYHKSGKILGVFDDEDNIVAERYIVIMNSEENQLAEDINLPLEERSNIIYLKSTIVDPQYTGNKLQFTTFKFVKELYEEKGYRKFMSTISPYNLFSLQNALNGGLKVRALKRKYPTSDKPNGVYRFITFLDENIKEVMLGDEIYIKRDNIESQLDILSKGYIGISLSEDKDFIIYDKIKEKIELL
ncbi:MAG: hypothetical protein ACTHWZ_06165 [Peptoniphilaceae bacterium]